MNQFSSSPSSIATTTIKQPSNVDYKSLKKDSR